MDTRPSPSILSAYPSRLVFARFWRWAMRPATSTTQTTCSKQPERVPLCIRGRASRTGPRGQLGSTAYPVWRRRFSRAHPAVSLPTSAPELPGTVLRGASGPSSRIFTLLVNVKSHGRIISLIISELGCISVRRSKLGLATPIPLPAWSLPRVTGLL